MVKPGKLIWVDLEMTGLDPDRQRIVEVAGIITDWNFKVLAEYHKVIHQSEAQLSKMDDWCKVQHVASGLIEQVKQSDTKESTVDRELHELVKKHCETPIILAGNSVHFDRRFIRRYLPEFDSLLHYRILDVSSWKLVLSARYGIDFKKPDKHRAVEDIKGSIEELQYYLRRGAFKK